MRQFFIFTLLCVPVLLQAQDKRTMRRLQKQVQEARVKDSLAQLNKPEAATTKNKIGDSLSDFRLVSSEHQSISRDELPKGKPILLVLFNPMCDHCQKVAMSLNENKDRFAHVSIVFITGTNLLGELGNFITASNLQVNDHFIISTANEAFTAPLFEAKGIPQIMAYNKDWKLQAVFFEHLDIEKTLEALGR